MGDQRIVGACSRCGRCCHFAYWVYGKHRGDLEYWKQYASRYWKEIDYRPGIQVEPTTFASMIVIPAISCMSLDPGTNLCQLHGDAKPRDCRVFPYNMPLDLFAAIRFKDCGFRVE